MASFSVKKFPFDLDIFSALNSRCPLVRNPIGHCSSGKNVTWL